MCVIVLVLLFIECTNRIEAVLYYPPNDLVCPEGKFKCPEVEAVLHHSTHLDANCTNVDYWSCYLIDCVLNENVCNGALTIHRSAYDVGSSCYNNAEDSEETCKQFCSNNDEIACPFQDSGRVWAKCTTFCTILPSTANQSFLVNSGYLWRSPGNQTSQYIQREGKHCNV